MRQNGFRSTSAAFARFAFGLALLLSEFSAVHAAAQDEPPFIADQPVSLTVTQAADAVFSVTVTGAEPLTYQWFFNETNTLDEATSATLTLTNVQPASAGGYTVIVSNAAGSVTSQVATLTVLVPPAIATQPQSQTVTNGDSANFSVTATGTPPLIYQWRRDGADLAGETNDTLTASVAGSYDVVVSNAAGSVPSDVAILTVLIPPELVAAPTSLVVTQGHPATFSVMANGTEPLSYQWFFQATNTLADATNAVLTLTDAQPFHAGDYTVRVSNDAGSVTSAAASLIVLVPPSITTQPQSQTMTNGDMTTFIVSAVGTEPLLYQWRRNGVDLPGETNPTLTTDQAGDYDVLVSNAAGNVASAVVVLTVLLPPTITAQPQSQTITNGDTAAFAVIANGTAPLGYQWRRDGVALAGETNATFTTGMAGSYDVVVSNAAGAITSDAAVLTVLIPPVITGQPLSLVVTQGQDATFTVAATGSEPLTYQWFVGLTNALPDATNSTLVITNVQSTHAGDYTVLVSNAAGSGTSALATLTVLVPPTITAQPQSLTITNGDTATFTAVAIGSTPLHHQWSRDGMELAGETSPSLTTGLAGVYSVRVTNVAGAVASDVATLAVLFPPAITQQPASLVVTQEHDATFSVMATGTGPLAYQWFFNATNLLAGATNASFFLTNVQPVGAGDYFVTVANAAGIVTSAVATLTVLVPPMIAQQPASQTITNGAVAAFTIMAIGTPPLNYQWRRDGAELAGETNATLTTGQPGGYDVVVGNAAGAVISETATLTVLFPPVIVDQPVSLTVTQGHAATFSVAATGTAPLSYQWLFNATNLLADATNATLTLINIQPIHAGDYTVLVSNAAGSVTSAVATLTVLVPPTITAQPQSQTITNGDAATFTVSATGSTPLSYQWRHNGVDLIGETSATLTTGQTGSYTVRVSNSAGSATSSVVTLTVLIAPVITDPPLSLTVTQGHAATFNVVAVGTAPLIHRWYFNETNLLADATNATLTLTNTQPGHAGDYTVLVSNSAGSVTSAVATLTVLLPPTITVQPQSQTITNGDVATLLVTAAGTEPLHYQWRREGIDLAGETNSVLSTGQAGSYVVQVSNAAGTAPSEPAIVTVLIPPAITQQPQSQTITNGDSATFAVTATGTAPLDYQWQYEGFDLPGETNATLTTGQPGGYTVRVSNVAGAITSDTATLTVLVPPVIAQQPVSLVVTQGDNVTFTVLATGTTPLSYQWFFQQTNALTDSTNASLTISNALPVHAGDYTVLVSNAAGSVMSAVATLTVLVPPAITAQPQSQTITNGDRATFTVIATGTAPLVYQWRRGGVDLAGETNATLTTGQSGGYDVVVGNAAGAVTSDSATLTVLFPPVIAEQPVSLVITQGHTAMFSVTATGTEPLIYQWYFNATNALSDATNATLTLANVQPAQAGDYTVRVSNNAGSITSAVAMLTVLVPPAITSQPQSQTITNGDSATFTVTAAGTAPLHYQWRRGGVDLIGDTSATLTTGQAGGYDVVVSNAAGAVISDLATLTVLLPPAIIEQPLSLTVTQGHAATFSVVATGTAPLSYQWLFNVTNLLADATNATLSLTNVQPVHAGAYQARVSNSAGTATSAVATLNVLVPPSITAQPQSRTITNGNSAAFTVIAIGTAPLRYQWTYEGFKLVGQTNATLAASQPGGYSVEVSNAAGTITSDTATLTVLIPPSITQQPQSLAVSNGAAATFTVGATGTGPLSYQWRRNGMALSGSTGSALTLAGAVPADAGDYSVIIANSAGTVTSVVARLTVLGPATIIGQPQSLVVTNGQGAVFRVDATGTPELRYQWRFNGATIPGETNRTLSLSNATTNQAGDYTVVVANGSSGSGGGSGTTLLNNLISYWKLDEASGARRDSHGTNDLAEVTPMGSAPGKSGAAGHFVSGDTNYLAHVHNDDLAVTGGVPFTFASWVWLDAKDDFKGFVLKRFTTQAETTEYQLYYSVVFDRLRFGIADGSHVANVDANALGSPQVDTWYFVVFWHDPAAQTVNIQINNGPVDSLFWPYGTQTTPGPFTLGRTIPGFYYLDGRIDSVSFWKRALTTGERAALFNGGAGVEYPFADTSPAPPPPTPDSGSVTSVVATLTVLVPPAITAQPLSRTNAVGTAASFSVSASGTTPLRYQWLFDGASAVAGATNATLAITNVQASHAGSYAVKVSNAAGAVTSSPAALVVSFAPEFVQQPQSVTVYRGEAVTFSSTVAGSSPLSYQWRHNGTNIAGATNAALTLTDVQTDDAGAYAVVASNPSGTATSLPATLTVFVPPVITQQPPSMTLTNGGNGLISVTATGLGPLQYQWRLNGVPLAGATNKTLPLSNVTPGQAGDYSVVVQNNPGASVRLLDGLTAYWKLDEASGARLDAHGTNHLTDVNGVGQIAGRLGPAARFIAANRTLLSRPANSDLTLGSDTPFTFSCWVYMNSKSDYMGFILKRLSIDGKNTEYQIYYDDAADRLALAITEGVHLGHVYANAIGSPPINTWMFVTAWHDPVADTINIQVNNGAVDSVTWTYGTQGTAAPFTLGQTVPGFYFLDGRLDGVAFWKRVLSGGERAELFNGGAGVEFPFTSTSQGPSLLATNDFSAVTSVVATVTVLVPPIISAQPQSRTNFPGTTASFTVSASGTTPLAYQWFLNETNALPGATNATLTLNNVQPGAAGVYTVRVGNISGTSTSLPATLTVAGPPVITAQPQNTTVDPGGTAYFVVSAEGAGTLAYQWRFNGNTLFGATNASILLFNVDANDAGSYTVVVSNAAGSVTSAAATLTLGGPVVLAEPHLAATGAFQFMLEAYAGRTYLIEASTNLVDWADLTTVTNTTGRIQFSDPAGTNFNHRFYRARALP